MKDFGSILLWIPAVALRLAMIAIGLIIVPLSMLGDGVKQTNPMWKLWANAADRSWWEDEDMKWWMYLYVPSMGALGYLTYGHWTSVYFILATISASLIVFSMERWRVFWWNGIRNPTPGVRDSFEQPILEPRPNPDDLVYGDNQKSATRFLRHGWQSEFWYIRQVGKKKFEFRIGWKYADGTPGFTPTISMRIGD